MSAPATNDTIDDVRYLASRAARLAAHADVLRGAAAELKPTLDSPPVMYLAKTIALREWLAASDEAALAMLVASRACDDLEQRTGDELALRACPRRLLRALEAVASTASAEEQEASVNAALQAETELRGRRGKQSLPPPMRVLGYGDLDGADSFVPSVEPAVRMARIVAELRHFYTGSRLVVDSTRAERQHRASLRKEEAHLRDLIAKYGHEVVSPEA